MPDLPGLVFTIEESTTSILAYGEFTEAELVSFWVGRVAPINDLPCTPELAARLQELDGNNLARLARTAYDTAGSRTLSAFQLLYPLGG